MTQWNVPAPGMRYTNYPRPAETTRPIRNMSLQSTGRMARRAPSSPATPSAIHRRPHANERKPKLATVRHAAQGFDSAK